MLKQYCFKRTLKKDGIFVFFSHFSKIELTRFFLPKWGVLKNEIENFPKAIYEETIFFKHEKRSKKVEKS